MLKPSIDELLEEINTRFALTIVIAKRARQLQLNPEDYKVEVPVGRANNEVARALEELHAGELEYYLDRDSMEEAHIKMAQEMEALASQSQKDFDETDVEAEDE